MKRHIQKTGVRKFFGQDFVDLQAEPLKALDAFFAAYGPCIIEGCAITQTQGGTFAVASGLVALESTDPESGAVAIRTMPFAGADGVAMPLYLVAEWVVVERAYGDGKVKPIAYQLRAVASGVVPEAPHLVLAAAGGNRFVDAVQDGTHRFISDAERTKWNDILRQAKEYAALQAEAAKRSAMAHTEGQVAAVRDELALGDQAAVNAAKAYADRIVAALVDNSPELLNTLEELAAALGGDPEFATTVMQAIGERATNTDLIAHTTSGAHVTPAERTEWSNRANAAGSESQYFRASYFHDAQDLYDPSWPLTGVGYCGAEKGGKVFRHCSPAWFKAQLGLWHSGNFNPAAKANKEGDLAQGFWARHILMDAHCMFGPGETLSGGYGSGDLVVHAHTGRGVLLTGDRLRYTPTITGPRYDIYHSGNFPMIRGSVGADGNRTGGSGFHSYKSGGSIYVQHGLGHSQFMAVATVFAPANAHRDNVVTVIYKDSTNVCFQVTAGPDTEIEWAPFDFIIMPY